MRGPRPILLVLVHRGFGEQLVGVGGAGEVHRDPQKLAGGRGGSSDSGIPRPLYMVAATSAGVVGRSFGIAPISSEAPTTWPPLMPPPAIDIVQHCGQWSRPPAGLIFGVRPNSPIATTIVLESSPRSCKSSRSRLYAVSDIGPTRS